MKKKWKKKKTKFDYQYQLLFNHYSQNINFTKATQKLQIKHLYIIYVLHVGICSIINMNRYQLYTNMPEQEKFKNIFLKNSIEIQIMIENSSCILTAFWLETINILDFLKMLIIKFLLCFPIGIFIPIGIPIGSTNSCRNSYSKQYRKAFSFWNSNSSTNSYRKLTNSCRNSYSNQYIYRNVFSFWNSNSSTNSHRKYKFLQEVQIPVGILIPISIGKCFPFGIQIY